MIRSPIQEVTNKLQFRAIGIVKGVYKPNSLEQINRGSILDEKSRIIETVILGKTLSLIKKYIKLENNYFWIVYPRNKTANNLHLQVAGIWDPYHLNKIDNNFSAKDLDQLLKELKLYNNYFSIRGVLIYVNTQKKEIIIKICSSPSKGLKNNSFKLVIQGEIPIKFLNHFVSLDVIRDDNTLVMEKYQMIEKI